MDTPRLSIITVTFNCKEDLQFTLDSVFSQDYTNFELIIIDGASTDGTVDLIKVYADDITFWLSEPDKGIYDAMNKGLKQATGDYVLFLNAGDLFYSSETLKRVNFEGNPSADIFYGETLILNEQREQVGLRRKSLTKQLVWQDFKRGMVVCHQSVIVKRSIAVSYDLKYEVSSDIDWVLRCLKLSSQTVYVPYPISQFVEGGVSSINRRESWNERWVIMKNHFGWVKTLMYHVVIVCSCLPVIFKFKSKYRKFDANKFK